MNLRRSPQPTPTPAPSRTPADYATIGARIEARVSQEFACPCTETEIRYRQSGRGARHYVRQCTRCFKWSGTLPRAAITAREVALALPVDTAAREVWEGQRRRYREGLLAAERADDSAAFWARYSEYLQSEEWRRKAALVLERDGGVCQGCRVAKAVQVHHLTYEHVFHELLFELVAVCQACHERVHSASSAGAKGK